MLDIRKGTMKVGAGSTLIEQERNLAKKGPSVLEEGANNHIPARRRKTGGFTAAQMPANDGGNVWGGVKN